MAVVIWQLYWSDLEERSLISKFQIGYRPNHSTQQPTILLTDEIRFEANDKKIVGALLLDLSKVFDTISYSVMLSKLKTYGINNEELEWLASYLFYRSQVVDFNKKRSNIYIYIYIVKFHQDQYAGFYCFSYFLMIFLMHSKSRKCYCMQTTPSYIMSIVTLML